MKNGLIFSKGSPGAGLFNIHASGGWAEMAGNHPCTNIGGQTFNTNMDEAPRINLLLNNAMRLFDLDGCGRTAW